MQTQERLPTSSLSSLALWFLGSLLNSSVSRRHSCKFSGETKSAATFVHDCECQKKVRIVTKLNKEVANASRNGLEEGR